MADVITVRTNTIRAMVAVMVATAAVLLLALWSASPAQSQTDAPSPLGTFAFLARADNPVDALAAGAVAGQLGAPVYLTGSTTLDEHARQGLVTTNPQVVVLAGGVAALSQAVEDQVRETLPDAQIRRFAGAGRTETARLVNELTDQLGIARPVVAGGTVTGDVGINGTLTVADIDVTTALTTLTARIDALESQNASLVSENAALKARTATLESTLAGVTRTTVDGRDTLRFTSMNLQVVNGTNTTDGDPNGLGNVIIGYNAPRPSPATTAADRAGSHSLIVGDQHHWTRFSHLIAGFKNTANGDYASVTGGWSNTVSGQGASVTAGLHNTASGYYAVVSGGRHNNAAVIGASILGGEVKSVHAQYACHPSCV